MWDTSLACHTSKSWLQDHSDVDAPTDGAPTDGAQYLVVYAATTVATDGCYDFTDSPPHHYFFCYSMINFLYSSTVIITM